MYRVVFALATSATALSPVVAQEPAPKARPITPSDTPKAKPVEETAPAIPSNSGGGEEVRRPSAVPRTEQPSKDEKASSPEEDLFNYAYMLYKREANDIGIEQFNKYLAAYPKGKHVDAAITLKGECLLRAKRIDEALACYTEVVKRFKSGQFLAYSASRLGTLKFNDNKHAEAAPYFEIAAINATKPDDRIQYRYYQGLALKYAGRTNESTAAFEASTKVTGGIPNNAFQEKALLEVGNFELGLNKKTAAFGKFERLSQEAVSTAVKAEAGVSAGLILLDSGKNKEAMSFFDPVLKIQDQPRWVSLAKFGLIRAAYAMEDWKKVVSAWNNLDIKEIGIESRPQLILMVANSRRVLEQYARAIDLYGMLEQFFPDSKETSEGSYRRLVCLYKMKDPRTDAAAEDFIEKLKQKDPSSEFLDMARLMRAEDSFSKKKWELAAKSYGGIRVEKIPENLRASMLYRKGWAEAQQGNHTLAVESLSQFINQFPNDPLVPQAMVRRAQSYLELKDITNAIKEFDSVVANYPDAKEAEEAFRLGGLLRGQDKNYEGMIERLTAMLDKYPNTKYKGECKFWIGTGLYGLKKWRECLAPLHEAQKLFTEQFEDASLKIIVAQMYLEDTDGLTTEIEAYLKTAPKAPVDGRILEYLGSHRYVEKNYAQATKFLGMAVTSAQSAELRPITWFQLAESRLQTADFPGVIASVDKLFSLGAELPSETKSKCFYFRGKANLALKKLDEAGADAKKGLDLHTQDVNESRIWFLRGEIETAKGNDDEAASNYVLTTELVLNDEIAVEAYRRLIKIFRKSGKSDKEKTFLEKFRKSFPKEAAAFEKEPDAIASQPAK